MILLNRQWTRQPQYRAPIGGQLSAGLVCGTLGSVPIYIGGIAPISYSVSTVPTAFGVGVRGTTPQQIARSVTTTSDLTLLIVGEVTSSTSVSATFGGLSHNGSSETFMIANGNGTTAGAITGRVYLGAYRTIGGSKTVAVGSTFVAVLRHRHNVDQTLWVNGDKDPSSGAFTGATVGNQWWGHYSGPSLWGPCSLGLAWNRALSEAEIAQLSDNPWQIFAPPRIWIPVSAATGTTINVPSGSLTLNGFAPNVSAPAVVAVPAGSLSLTGFAPSVSTPRTVAVPAGALSLTGFAPTVATPRTISVPAGSLTLTGYAPTVSTTAAGTTVSVPAGSLTLTGFAPTVSISAVIPMTAGALTLTGFAPTVLTTAGVVITPPAGGLTLTGFAPSVYTLGGSTTSVAYLSIRTSASGMSGSVDQQTNLENLRSLLPAQRSPNTNSDRTTTAEWYRFFDYLVNVYLGGLSTPTITDIVSSLESTLQSAINASVAAALAQQQSQQNAESLAATVEVVKNNGLTGASEIPPVRTSYYTDEP